jgi:hypothetical protein
MMHQSIKPAVVFLMMALVSSLSRAEFLSVADLSEYFDALHRTGTDEIRDGDWQKVATLQGFVMGVSDSVRDVRFCAPKGTSLGKMIEVTDDYIAANPELWDRPAVGVTIKALSSAYPCKK